jgi:hypothetical protein
VSMVVKGRGVNGGCVEKARGAWKRQGRGKTAIADGRQRFKRAQAEPSGVSKDVSDSQTASQPGSVDRVRQTRWRVGRDQRRPSSLGSLLASFVLRSPSYA